MQIQQPTRVLRSQHLPKRAGEIFDVKSLDDLAIGHGVDVNRHDLEAFAVRYHSEEFVHRRSAHLAAHDKPVANQQAESLRNAPTTGLGKLHCSVSACFQ